MKKLLIATFSIALMLCVISCSAPKSTTNKPQTSAQTDSNTSSDTQQQTSAQTDVNASNDTQPTPTATADNAVYTVYDEETAQFVLDFIGYLGSHDYDKYLKCFTRGPMPESRRWGQDLIPNVRWQYETAMKPSYDSNEVDCWEDRIISITDVIIMQVKDEHWDKELDLYAEKGIDEQKLFIVKCNVEYDDNEHRYVHGLNYFFITTQVYEGELGITEILIMSPHYSVAVEKYEPNQDDLEQYYEKYEECLVLH